MVRHLVEALGEMHGQEPITTLALVPLWWCYRNVGKGLGPPVLHRESHRVRQIFLKQLRGFLEAFYVVLFDAAQKFTKSQHFGERASAAAFAVEFGDPGNVR